MVQTQMVIENGAFREQTVQEIEDRISLLKLLHEETEIEQISRMLEIGHAFIALHNMASPLSKTQIHEIRKRNRIKPREMVDAMEIAELGLDAMYIWEEGGWEVMCGREDTRPYRCGKCKLPLRYIANNGGVHGWQCTI